ncbi:polyprenyl synthetase family protein [Gleimia hominis]|uniref:polyprenyl synthetase family protein n=1 Tax=Gleimia hominis TaxID=595468 RepID=UPI000C808EC4
MATVSDIPVASPLEERINADLARVEELLSTSVRESRAFVNELLSHLSTAGGKRIRPLLTLLCAHLAGAGEAASEQVIAAATSVEMTHLASLYHDDVMDAAPQRRGVPAAQMQWGNNRAILAGDVLFSRASKLTAGLGTEAVDYHARTFERLCLGQLNETFGPTDGEDRVDFYVQVLADKTGSLINAAAVFGAMFGGARPQTVEAVGEYGEQVGIAFQLADDVIDLTSDSELTGKTPGTDLVEGVSTLPVLLLHQDRERGELDECGKQILQALEHEDLRDPAVLSGVVEKLANHAAVERTRSMARTYVDKAIDALSAVEECEAKNLLVDFAHQMVDRIS